jgi:hypothetical protein
VSDETQRRGRWRSWFEHANVGLLVLDPSGLVVEANQRALGYLGVSRLSPRERRVVAIDEVVRRAGECGADRCSSPEAPPAPGLAAPALIHADLNGGGLRWYAYSCAPLPRADGRSDRLVSLLDVDGCHAATDEREAMVQRTSEASAAADVAATIADEFADVLTTVLGNVSLATAGLNGDRAALLAEAEAACLDGRQVLRDLLTVAHCDSPTRRPLDVTALARDAATAVCPEAMVSAAPAEGVWQCLGDAEQVREAFAGMLAEAAAAAQDRPLRLALQNREWLGGEGLGIADGRYVVLAVTFARESDAAPAVRSVPEEWQVPTRSGSRLLAVWAIARRHGGQLLARVGPGETTYALLLPAAPG